MMQPESDRAHGGLLVFMSCILADWNQEAHSVHGDLQGEFLATSNVYRGADGNNGTIVQWCLFINYLKPNSSKSQSSWRRCCRISPTTRRFALMSLAKPMKVWKAWFNAKELLYKVAVMEINALGIFLVQDAHKRRGTL
ncbi:hypothetical protein SUGI_0960270 [Cryptomeria japonica]|nr:hypothetical protein SUGI_0960270 [Cryptomeria japonica]